MTAPMQKTVSVLLCYVATLLLSCTVLSPCAGHVTNSLESEAEVMFEWVVLDYAWDDDESTSQSLSFQTRNHSREAYLASGEFIPENCLLAGVAVDKVPTSTSSSSRVAGTKAAGQTQKEEQSPTQLANYEDMNIYLTVPRWRPGVPATLTKLDVSTGLLTPFPSWDVQLEGVEGCLQNVQSAYVDSQHQLWAVEVGRRNFFSDSPVPGTPGVWTIDTLTGTVTSKYYFPEDVVSSTESFLNDIVLDEGRGFAYFTDAWGDGALITLDLTRQLSRRYSGPSTKNDPTYTMIINGQFYGKHIFTTPSDGLAITEDCAAIFYCQVQGTTLYRLPTEVLRDFTSSQSEMDAAVDTLGTKEPSDGMAYVNGELFWGALTTSTVYRMAVDATEEPDMSTEASMAVEINQETMEWVDTFAVQPVDATSTSLSAFPSPNATSEGTDLAGSTKSPPAAQQYLWFVSNRLDKYSVQTMDFSGAEGANMRLLRMNL